MGAFVVNTCTFRRAPGEHVPIADIPDTKPVASLMRLVRYPRYINIEPYEILYFYLI